MEIARFDRHDIEGASEGKYNDDRIFVLDETGLHALGLVTHESWLPPNLPDALRCSLILNTLAEDLQVYVLYRDGSEAKRTWPACKPVVWSGQDIGRRNNTRIHRGGLVRFVVARDRDGKVLHDFDHDQYHAEVAGQQSGSMLLVTESGFEPAGWKYLVGSEYVSLGPDYHRHCASP